MNRLSVLPVLALSLLAGAAPAGAQINRCVGPDGKVEFRNMACPATSVSAAAHVRPSVLASGAPREAAAEKPAGDRTADGDGKRRSPPPSAPVARP